MGVAAAAQDISITLVNGAFRVVGWNAPTKAPQQGWPSILRVYSSDVARVSGQSTDIPPANLPPLAGSYSVESGVLVFHPRFPVTSGVRYFAVFQLPGGKPVEVTFNEKRADTTPTTHVVHVYPSADVLPSNTLKLYIYFSAPMSRGEAWQHIHLADAAGKPLKYEFVEIQQELWNEDNTRMTVLFDPGRIKRGVLPEMQLGPPIVAGKRYTLVIDRGWHDANGVPLIESYRKRFRGGPADRMPPDPETWHLMPPRAATSQDFVLDFPKSMDYALLQRLLAIVGPQGDVPGKITVDDQEKEWRFTPQKPWPPGNYQLLVDTAIEDLCGNHIGQAFDLDKFQQITKSIESKTLSLPFHIS